jgi:hypothetical protein
MGTPSGTMPASSFCAAASASLTRLLRGRALGLQHVQPDQQQHNAAGQLKRRQRNAEQPEDGLARKRKSSQHNQRGQRTFARNAPPPRRVGALGNRQKRRQRGEGDPPGRRWSSAPAARSARTPSAASRKA